MKQIDVTIDTPFIRLDALLKFAHLVSSGGEAKVRIQSGEVLVNGAVCTARGKKLTEGDVASALGTTVRVRRSGQE